MNCKINVFILFIGLLFTAFACKEFLEEDIKDRQVTLLSPGNQAQIPTYTVTFLWEQLDDALEYRLQVASPDFDSVSLYHADTVVTAPKFTLSLEPGIYQWRVQARNGSSETMYTTRAFVIYESDLSKQVVVQTDPADQLLTANTALRFGWQTLFGATGYRLQIDTNNFTDPENLLYDGVLESTGHNFTIPKEQVYQWRVRAESDTSQSMWSTVRQFTYDRTPPAVPTMTAPGNNASVSSPVTLRWEAVSDAVKYQLYVYKSDSTTLYSSTYPLSLEGTSHNFTSSSIGERVIWRLRATDKAGNTSGYSSYRSFMINQ